jgi:transposase
MTQSSMTTAGIDTSKGKLDVAVHGRTGHWQVANSLAGWRVLATKLTEAGVSRIGIEATGGYERGVVVHLRAAGFTVLVLQPIQVKAYGRVHLRRAKNDVLDAVLIAACAAALDQVRTAPDQRLAESAKCLTFLEQVEEDIRRCKTGSSISMSLGCAAWCSVTSPGRRHGGSPRSVILPSDCALTPISLSALIWCLVSPVSANALPLRS